MAQRRTIGSDPLDAVLPGVEGDKPVKTSPPPPEKEPSTKKQRLTVHLPVDLINRAKNVVYWTPGLTLAGLAETAFARIIDEIESERGEPFPHRAQELKGGRPLK